MVYINCLYIYRERVRSTPPPSFTVVMQLYKKKIVCSLEHMQFVIGVPFKNNLGLIVYIIYN